MRTETEKFVSLGEIPREPSEQDIQDIDELSSRIKDLERKVGDVEKSAERVQKQTEKTSNFILAIVVGIAVVVGVAFIEVSYDYLKNNEERYEKFISKTEEMRKDFYTKEELKLPLSKINTNTEVLNCIKSKGYFSPQCFD